MNSCNELISLSKKSVYLSLFIFSISACAYTLTHEPLTDKTLLQEKYRLTGYENVSININAKSSDEKNLIKKYIDYYNNRYEIFNSIFYGSTSAKDIKLTIQPVETKEGLTKQTGKLLRYERVVLDVDISLPDQNLTFLEGKVDGLITKEEASIFGSMVAERLGSFKDKAYDQAIQKLFLRLSKIKEHRFSVIAKPRKKITKLSSSSKLVGQSWAVVIGISDYRSSDIPDLLYASSDAKHFYDFLTSNRGCQIDPSHTRLLLDREATISNVREALGDFLQQVIEEDIVYIYLSGHGVPRPNNPQQLYFIPYDANLSKLAATAYPMWELKANLQHNVLARKIVIVADACHSAGFGDDVQRRSILSVNRFNAYLQTLAEIGDGIVIITASEEGQLSMEGEKWGGGYGVFTYHFLKALSGKADYNADGVVTITEAMNYTSEKVRRDTNSQQRPTLSGRFDPLLPLAIPNINN